MDDRPLPPREVAAMFGVHPRTVKRWADAGKLPVITTPGGQSRYRPSDVERLIEGRKTPAGAA
jgi:excisionase family DNA binding protein